MFVYIKKINPDIIAVLVSGHVPSKEVSSHFKKALFKPFGLNEFKEMLNSVIEEEL